MERIRKEVTAMKQGEVGEPGPLRRIIRKKYLPEFVGLKRTAVDDAIKRGDFPRPIKIGPRAVGWLEEDIAQWQHSLIAQRDAGSKSS